uniref:Uncharacterized protein LOC114324720 n=1 Tax=Diabrotica virgifera virgifera TaxID=50390 RepID=A0A6P7F0G4_DIAVI
MRRNKIADSGDAGCLGNYRRSGTMQQCDIKAVGLRPPYIGRTIKNTRTDGTRPAAVGSQRKKQRGLQIEVESIPSTSKSPTTSKARSNVQQRYTLKKSDEIEDFQSQSLISTTSLTMTDVTFPVVARTLDRYGVSDRAGAAIISAAFQDIGLITESDSSRVIDRSRVRRARSKARATISDEPTIFDTDTIGLFYDGRKDKTLIHEDGRRRVTQEEHITILKEPDSEYLGHISLKTGDAKTICNSILTFLSSKSIDANQIMAIGCDGTAVNTGIKGGVIRLLEIKFQRPLQWLICQLHANELTLRHLFQHLDGTTSGPKGFIGPIGKAVTNCEVLPVVPFDAIQCALPNITKSTQELSTDQLYLLQICQYINSGHCDASFAKINPGEIVGRIRYHPTQQNDLGDCDIHVIFEDVLSREQNLRPRFLHPKDP